MSTEGTHGRGELPSVEITRGTPSEEDLAALAGVLPTAYLEETEHATADEQTARSAWNRSRRMRRTPGSQWGRFAG
ncbi:acyl-CoA carboxylase epsilon subunit [Microbacterium halotolerans]|uniref:acyl-CoA carboxylase epsilon subunit n=1 Tax=Microbacterium halotolerans TaxID=246613 RepID=UPI000E6AE0EB|nr:acyl-CoA carboxylase epsilon subunit [Microbacterium halotolerans]